MHGPRKKSRFLLEIHFDSYNIEWSFILTQVQVQNVPVIIPILHIEVIYLNIDPDWVPSYKSSFLIGLWVLFVWLCSKLNYLWLDQTFDWLQKSIDKFLVPETRIRNSMIKLSRKKKRWVTCLYLFVFIWCISLYLSVFICIYLS